MAKKKAAKKAMTKRLPKLTPLASQIVLYLVNNLAIGDYDRCCAVEDIAKHLRKTEGRVKKLVEQLIKQATCRSRVGCWRQHIPPWRRLSSKIRRWRPRRRES